MQAANEFDKQTTSAMASRILSALPQRNPTNRLFHREFDGFVLVNQKWGETDNHADSAELAPLTEDNDFFRDLRRTPDFDVGAFLASEASIPTRRGLDVGHRLSVALAMCFPPGKASRSEVADLFQDAIPENGIADNADRADLRHFFFHWLQTSPILVEAIRAASRHFPELVRHAAAASRRFPMAVETIEYGHEVTVHEQGQRHAAHDNDGQRLLSL
jgi:hypothetical protein